MRVVRNFSGEQAWIFREEAESILHGSEVRTLEDDQHNISQPGFYPARTPTPTLSLNGGSCPGVGWNGWEAFPSIGNGEAAMPSTPPGMGSWPSR